MFIIFRSKLFAPNSISADQLYQDHVVGEGIRVAEERGGLLAAPALETKVEGVVEERQEDERVGYSVGSQAEFPFC